MPTHVALLRGVNVGGGNKVAMADLREVATSLGNTDVATYIQSGNVVFTSREHDTAAVAAALEQRIADSLGVRPSVVVLSAADLAQVVADNPFPEDTDPKKLHAVLRSTEMGSDEVAAVAAAEQRAKEKGSRDEARVVGRTLFLHTPDGMGRSELTAQLTRAGTAKAFAAGTARNWSTVTKLLSLLDG